MAAVEGSVRQARDLGKRAKKRVENDIDLAYERSKSILEHWDVMKFMDAVWTAREETPEKNPCGKLRPYMIAAAWFFCLILLYLVYYVDIEANPSIIWHISIRFGEITCLSLAVLCVLCCFEQGLNLIMGGLFLVSVFWSAPPKKRSPKPDRRWSRLHESPTRWISSERAAHDSYHSFLIDRNVWCRCDNDLTISLLDVTTSFRCKVLNAIGLVSFYSHVTNWKTQNARLFGFEADLLRKVPNKIRWSSIGVRIAISEIRFQVRAFENSTLSIGESDLGNAAFGRKTAESGINSEIKWAWARGHRLPAFRKERSWRRLGENIGISKAALAFICN